MPSSAIPPSRPLRIGTRGSPLALIQARLVAAGLRAAHGLGEDAVEICVIKTTGDRVQDRALSELGGKGLFTKEIEEALLQGEVDLAVHSMKDVPTVLPPGLIIDCLLPREDPRDAFISRVASSLGDLPGGAKVGSSSLRRQAQVKALRPDLEIVPFRGNVDTRLEKLERGDVAATLLAVAGLTRMGRHDEITATFTAEEMLPALAQGAVGVQRREDDQRMAGLLTPLHERATGICVAAERGFLIELDGSCRTPIAGLATLDGDQVSFRGQVLTVDGARSVEVERAGSADAAEALGRAAGEEVRAQAGPGFFMDEA